MSPTIRSLCGSLVVITLLASASPARADEMKIPQTAADHEALAKSYDEKAATYEKEAQLHRGMLAAFKKSHAETTKNPNRADLAKMEMHCSSIVKDAEKLAADVRKAAEFHHLEAKELEGK